MRLQLMTWPEVEIYLERSKGLIVPIGSTEQHGPTGVIGTDAICAETLAWRAGELADAMVGPTLTVGMSEHHMHFPGSVTLRPTTLVAVVRDVILSLARHGFRRLFFVTPSAKELSVELFGDKDGDHASASEVSIASAAYPGHLKIADLDPEVPPSTHVFGPADFRRRYPEGRMGSHPELASVEAGEKIIEAVSADLAKEYREFLTEE